MNERIDRVEAEIADLEGDELRLKKSQRYENLNLGEEVELEITQSKLADRRNYRNTLVTALANQRVEEQKKDIFERVNIKVSRHKPKTAIIDSQCILTNIAAIFQEEYELDVKEGDTATFGDVLWALGNASKNPEYYRAPAAPKEGITVPIHKRLLRKEWIYYKALNDFINPKPHPLPIPEIDGEMKLILPNDKHLYNPNRIEATFRKLGIIEPEEIITFQKEEW